MRRTSAMLLGVVAIAVLSLVASPLGASGLVASVAGIPATSASPAPSASPTAAPTVAPAPAAPAPAASHPATPVCPTPQNAPHWNSLFFFNDVEVSFFVPHNPSMDGSGFQIAPCSNTIPTYVNGFYLNVTTNARMVNAVVTVWGTQWPTSSAGTPPIIKGFDPATPLPLPMNLLGPTYTTAEFYFDDYRYFWPGDHVYFNLTIQTSSASPSTIYSANPTTGHSAQFNYSGLIDNYTWQYYVQAPFASTNFASDVAVHTSPSVLGSPAYDPNRHQNLTINLTSLTYYNGTQQPIPNATGEITESVGHTSNTYSLDFAPLNATTISTTVPPNPGANCTFNFTVYLPWEHGVVDEVKSPFYTFNWTTNGGWWYPTLGLIHNLNLTSYPNVFLGTGQKASFPTGTEINITVHSPIQNVTISNAEIVVHYSDAAGAADGTIVMTSEGQNTTYGLIPGLPNGGSATFYVVAKDIYGTPVASGNTTYTESGTPTGGPGDVNLAAGYGIFFFEAVDLTTGRLVSFLNYTITNATWSETRQGTPLGFGAPEPLAGTGFLAVTYGTYTIQVRAFNQTETATISVNSPTPTTVVFYVASGSVPQDTWVQQTTMTVPAVIGLVGAAVAVWPVSTWFRERRKKTEQEQRRITL